MEEKTARRVVYLDALRVISMFAVMVIHLAATGYREAAPGSYEWLVCLIYNSMARFAVPVFVMISGAIYLDPARAVTMADMLKKAGSLMLIFFGWSLVYALAESVKEHPMFKAGYFLSVAQKTVTGHYHMWYVYMIAVLYLATPFLRPIAADVKLLRQFLLLTFLLNHCLRLLCVLPGIGETARSVAGKADLGLFSGYAGYYCLGYYLHNTEVPHRKAGTLMLASMVLLTAAVAGSIFLGLTDAVVSEKMPHNVLYSAAVFLFFKSRNGWLAGSRIKSIIEKVAPCTFGMYFVHPVFNFLTRRSGLYALTFDPLFCIPLCSALVCAASFLVIRLMKSLPVLRRFA